MHRFFVIEFCLSGLLLVGAAIPLILRKIPPNRLYGFRVRKTLQNPDVWYPANEYAGKSLVIAGAVITAAALALAPLSISANAYAITLVVLLIASLLAALVSSLIYLRTL